jgi:carbon storage regulator CsrA
MLVLTRREGESVFVPSAGLSVTVNQVIGGKVALAFNAPDDSKILRAELMRGDDLELFRKHRYKGEVCHHSSPREPGIRDSRVIGKASADSD